MKQNEQKTYPPLDNLEGRTVEQLLALRQQIREVRDQKRIAINEEITAEQTALRREGINQRRTFDIELNELKRQLDEIGTYMGTPAVRIKATDIREKMSELKYKFSMAVVERDAKDARLATDRIRRNAQAIPSTSTLILRPTRIPTTCCCKRPRTTNRRRTGAYEVHHF